MKSLSYSATIILVSVTGGIRPYHDASLPGFELAGKVLGDQLYHNARQTALLVQFLYRSTDLDDGAADVITFKVAPGSYGNSCS